MKYQIIFLFIFTMIFQSCVPYKDIVYVQGNLPENQIDSTTYKIQKNDILYINIKSSEESVEHLFNIQKEGSSNNVLSPQSLYFNGYTVDSQGFVELPVVGKINVLGKTFSGVKTMIKEKLLATQFSNLGDLFIKVKLAGVPYTVIGEVKTPQNGVLYKVKPNIFDALSDAHDITLVGNRREVVVIRNEQNQQIKQSLDLTDANVINSPYFYIRPNDIIYVKPLKQKVWGTGATLQQTISTTITALSLITTIILFSKYVN